MEYRIIGKVYAFRSRRCFFCNRRAPSSAALVDIYVPSQTDLGAEVIEHIQVAHAVCAREKGLEMPKE